MKCVHDNGIAPLRDWNNTIIGDWCYKCHKTWFTIKKGEMPIKTN